MSEVLKFCAGSLALISTLAMAGGQSSASIGSVRFNVLDLDATDGVTAAYELLPSAATGQLTGASVSAGDDSVLFASLSTDNASGMELFEPLLIQAELGGAYSSVHIENGVISVSGGFSASGPLAQYEARAGTGGVSPYQGGLWSIDLTPQSVLFITVDAEASAWAGNLLCETGTEANAYGMGAGCGPEVAAGVAAMSLRYQYAGINGTNVSYSFYDEVRAQADVYSAYGGFIFGPEGLTRELLWVDPDESQHNSDTLTAVFVNSSDEYQRANLMLNATAFGYGMWPTPVPEASTLSMYGLGLFALACIRRWHRVVKV